MPNEHFLLDVETQFNSLNVEGERIAILEGFPPDFVDKRYSIFHRKGGKNNHFQGVQRLGNYLLVTGSHPYRRPRSDLFVVRLGSRPNGPGPWGSNLVYGQDPSPSDRLVNYYPIDSSYWHPGGLSLLDTLAVIPLENSKGQSRIRFLDLSDPVNPKQLLQLDIERPTYKAGACAVTSLPKGGSLLAVWSDSDHPELVGEPPRCHLDVYYLGGGDGMWRQVAYFYPSASHRLHCKLQSMDFVWQGSSSGRSDLYLIGFENTGEPQPNPLDPGDNCAYLMKVDLACLPALNEVAPVALPEAFLTPVATRTFATSGNWCNMDAGSCAYVDNNQQLIVYSVYHFMAPIRAGLTTGDPAVKCLEFRSTSFGEPILDLEDAWVELYEHPGLEGRRLTLLGHSECSIEDTRHAFVGGHPFAGVMSARYQVPDGHALVLFTKPHYAGACPLVIIGNGMVQQLDVIAQGYGGLLGSCQFLPETSARALQKAIVVA